MDLTKLLALQKIDYKILDVEASIGDLPDQVEILKEKVAASENDLEQSKHQLEDVSLEKAMTESETKSLYEKLKKYQEQVYNVTTNKEYDAISSEIERTELSIEQNETKVLELMEKEEKLNQQIKMIGEEVDTEKKDLHEKEEHLREKLDQNKDRLEALKTERQEITSTFPKPILATYERIRKGRNGVAIAEIKNYTCSECFATIPAQTVVEVRKMDQILLCETCGRILAATNNQPSAQLID
ncbi:hypothetical protein JW960_17410 [candidate division KSB1 bacterium]|nr:hypothetical protein [candidate division KSB1 bacterium]